PFWRSSKYQLQVASVAPGQTEGCTLNYLRLTDIGHWTLDIGHWTLDLGRWTGGRPSAVIRPFSVFGRPSLTWYIAERSRSKSRKLLLGSAWRPMLRALLSLP